MNSKIDRPVLRWGLFLTATTLASTQNIPSTLASKNLQDKIQKFNLPIALDSTFVNTPQFIEGGKNYGSWVNPKYPAE